MASPESYTHTCTESLAAARAPLHVNEDGGGRTGTHDIHSAHV